LVGAVTLGVFPTQPAPAAMPATMTERQLTRGPGGRILTNSGVWSPDGEWLVYDVRSDPAGSVFDGDRIEIINVITGEIQTVYHSRNGARCGAASFNPRTGQVVLILGPEFPTKDWDYGPYHRQGVVLDWPGRGPGAGRVCNLDARDLVPPFTAGALRGGTHLHIWDSKGDWVCFTYEDHILAQLPPGAGHDLNQRNIGVSVPGHPVRVPTAHARNLDGEFFSAIVTRTTPAPRPGSDEIQRACEEAWVGTNGYLRADGRRQTRALAFQGQVIDAQGHACSEVFVVDLPSDVALSGEGPLAGTPTRYPAPPRGTVQRRLTRTADWRYPGLQGPRHWLRSSPDGAQIAFLAKDVGGVVQLWTVSPLGGSPRQVTTNHLPIASAFTWSPDGKCVAHVMDNSVCITRLEDGVTTPVTGRTDEESAPRPEACVFSPDGRSIAFIRRLPSGGGVANQIMVVSPVP